MSNLKTIEQAVKDSEKPLSAAEIASLTGLKAQQVLMSLSYLARAGKLKREKVEKIFTYSFVQS